ncbi:HNH endonuclease signature motif containing protein [Ewingella americana]
MTDYNSLFTYCKTTGLIYWKVSRGCIKKGSIVKSMNSHGYSRVMINKVSYRTHRVIWEMHHGEIPDGMFIDHIDGDFGNNRIENLRVVNKEGNAKNMPARCDSKTGITGVSWSNRHNLWQAYININNQRIHLGWYSKSDFIKACEARIVAEVSAGFHINHGRVV